MKPTVPQVITCISHSNLSEADKNLAIKILTNYSKFYDEILNIQRLLNLDQIDAIKINLAVILPHYAQGA